MFDAPQKVQAVINRLKKERRQSDVGSRPAVEALAEARPVALLGGPCLGQLRRARARAGAAADREMDPNRRLFPRMGANFATSARIGGAW